jgi:hypothetical protein
MAPLKPGFAGWVATQARPGLSLSDGGAHGAQYSRVHRFVREVTAPSQVW